MMKKTYLAIAATAVIASIALLAGGGGQASASSACPGDLYNTSNGGTTVAGATNIGTVGPGCLEIGYFGATPSSDPNANVNNDVALVNTSHDPSVYEFTWGGGNLMIQEEQGSNGIGYNIDVELALASEVTVVTGANNSGGNLTPAGDVLASITIPQATQFTAETVFSGNLGAGTYVLDTYLGTCASDCSNSGDSTDPEVAMLFSPSATPLPATLPLFATGLGLVGMSGWRRKRKNAAAIAAA
jgi:hypothetical protein